MNALKTLLAAGLLVSGATLVNAAVQMETAESCCLASEWVAAVPADARQGLTCCLPDVWRLDETAGPAAPQARDDHAGADRCCIADLWYSD